MKKLLIAVVCMSLMLVGGNAMADPYAEADATIENVGATITQIDNSENTVIDRKFAPVGVTPMPQTNGFFTSPTPDSSFRSVKDILMILADGQTVRVSDGALDNMAKGGSDVEVNFQVINDADIVPRAYDKKFKGTRYLYITIVKPAGLKVTAMVDAEADQQDTNSLMVLGQAGRKALKDGNNVMVVTAEGAHRLVKASGWGVGAYISGASVNESGKEAISPGGGTGYASNKSGTEDMPWFQGYAGVDMSKPEMAKADPSDEKTLTLSQTGNHTQYGSTQDK